MERFEQYVMVNSSSLCGRWYHPPSTSLWQAGVLKFLKQLADVEAKGGHKDPLFQNKGSMCWHIITDLIAEV